MTQFFVAPYQPTSDPAKWESLKTESDLRIDANNYEQALRERWPGIEFLIPTRFLLQWGILVSPAGARIYGALHKDQQVVSIDSPFEEFLLWHRGIIPSKYRLCSDPQNLDSRKQAYHSPGKGKTEWAIQGRRGAGFADRREDECGVVSRAWYHFADAGQLEKAVSGQR